MAEDVKPAMSQALFVLPGRIWEWTNKPRTADEEVALMAGEPENDKVELSVCIPISCPAVVEPPPMSAGGVQRSL